MSAITTVNISQQYFIHGPTSEPAANQNSERGRFNITSAQIALLSQPRPVSLKMTKQPRGWQSDRVEGDFLLLLLPRWSLEKLAIMRLVKPAR